MHKKKCHEVFNKTIKKIICQELKIFLEKDFNFLFTNNEFWYDDEDVELHEFVCYYYE